MFGISALSALASMDPSSLPSPPDPQPATARPDRARSAPLILEYFASQSCKSHSHLHRQLFAGRRVCACVCVCLSACVRLRLQYVCLCLCACPSKSHVCRPCFGPLWLARAVDASLTVQYSAVQHVVALYSAASFCLVATSACQLASIASAAIA